MSPIHDVRAPLLVAHALAGDLLMAVPALRALGSRYGFDRPLVCGTEQEHAALLRALGFTQLHPTLFHARARQPGETQAEHAGWDFDVDAVLPLARHCDLIIGVTDAPGPAFSALARASGLPSLGFRTVADADRPAACMEDWVHTFDRFFALAREACGAGEVLSNHAWFPHRADAGEIRSEVRAVTGPGRLVVLHADTKPDKMWPLPCWAQWLQKLWHDEPHTQVLLLGYPEIPIGHYATDARLHDCRDLPLTVNYEIAGMADQFIGIDSCMLHAADLCRVPSVGLFTGLFPPAIFGLRFADGEMLCGGNPPGDITVDAVWSAYRRVRDRQPEKGTR